MKNQQNDETETLASTDFSQAEESTEDFTLPTPTPGVRTNNKMERMNGEIRGREKVMWSLKKPDTPIPTEYQMLRPYEALDGKTPAEVAPIKVEGQDKGLTIIQNASASPKIGKT
jgi:hypothetical protein